MEPTTHVLEVWGHFACFSRPELKVERWSYICPTPSAVRGIFDAVYLKPSEFRWQPTRVEVLSPPSYIALRRNEVKDVASVEAVARWMIGEADPEPLWADGDRDLLGTDEKGRTQRQTMALKNVHYRLHAQIRSWPGFESQMEGLDAQFRRRAERGKCIYQPYLGVREFPAFFAPAGAGTRTRPVKMSQDLGLMLYDVFDLSRPGSRYDQPSISLFHAKLEEGVVRVPDYASADVLKPEESTV